MASAASSESIAILNIEDEQVEDGLMSSKSRNVAAASHKRRLGSLCRLTLLAASALGIFIAGHLIGRWFTRGAGSIRLTIWQQPTAEHRSHALPAHAEAQLPPSRQNVTAISMHTVAMTNCNRFQDWQMIGLYWSFLRCACMQAWSPCKYLIASLRFADR